jgi:hypothetical protein
MQAYLPILLQQRGSLQLEPASQVDFFSLLHQSMLF